MIKGSTQRPGTGESAKTHVPPDTSFRGLRVAFETKLDSSGLLTKPLSMPMPIPGGSEVYIRIAENAEAQLMERAEIAAWRARWPGYAYVQENDCIVGAEVERVCVNCRHLERSEVTGLHDCSNTSVLENFAGEEVWFTPPANFGCSLFEEKNEKAKGGGQ